MLLRKQNVNYVDKWDQGESRYTELCYGHSMLTHVTDRAQPDLGRMTFHLRGIVTHYFRFEAAVCTMYSKYFYNFEH